MSGDPRTLPTDFDTMNQLVTDTRNTIKKQGNSFDVKGRLVTLPSEGEVLVLGDTHGDFHTFRNILKDAMFFHKVENSRPYTLILLGDYVDRGPYQVELLYIILRMLQTYPENILLLRGNHEGPSDIKFRPNEFHGILQKRYPRHYHEIQDNIQALFDQLYLAVHVPDRALFVHAGIPTKAKGLNAISYAHNLHPEKSTLVELLWNDPSEKDGLHPSSRGIGWEFGPDIAGRFLDKVKAPFLIRGHQSSSNGYMFTTDRVLTLFSCKLPHYGNRQAGYLQIPLEDYFTRAHLEKHIHRV